MSASLFSQGSLTLAPLNPSPLNQSLASGGGSMASQWGLASDPSDERMCELVKTVRGATRAHFTEMEAGEMIRAAFRYRRNNPHFSGKVEKEESYTQRPLLISSEGRIFILFTRQKEGDKLIGKGNFKRIKLAVDVTRNKVCVVGIMRLQTRGIAEAFRREVDIMQRLRGVPHIVQWQADAEANVEYGSVPWGNTVRKGYLVMEYCEGGDLSSAMRRSVFSDEKKRSLARECLLALKGMREKEILHRDIKPENILLALGKDRRLHVKLGDFGLSCLMNEEGARKICGGTPIWVSPEVARAALIGRGVLAAMQYPHDVCAVGMVLHYLFKERVFRFQQGLITRDQLHRTSSVQQDAIEKEVKAHLDPTHVYQRVIIGMMKVDPKERWTVEKAIEELS